MHGHSFASSLTDVFRVQSVRELSRGAYVVRTDRHGIDFEPGQHIIVGPSDDINMREYSVYSSPKDDYLEILVKEVQDGYVSPRLRRLVPGEPVTIQGPMGYFLLPEQMRSRPLLFVATGTGISPFRSFVRSYGSLDYRLLHGVRYADEAYDRDTYDPARHVLCVSREDPRQDAGAAVYHGRVTDYLKSHPADPSSSCFLCGNCDMIYEAFDILKDQGVDPSRVFAEVYF